MSRSRLTGWALRAVGRPSLWLPVALFALVTLLQIAAFLGRPAFLANLTADLGLTRYTVERILYLLPITWIALSFGWKGGAITSLIAAVCMLPRALFDSPVREDALVETGAVLVVGSLVSYSLESLRTERKRQDELRAHLRVIEASQKRLAALNETSRISSRSLELSEVLEGTVECVKEVMGVETIFMYNLDEEARELVLAAHRGASEKFVKAVERLRIGEGFNGTVADTGNPLLIEDASQDPRLTKEVVRQENIRSLLIVPLTAKGKVVGTVCAATRALRSFLPEEEELLTAIGNQVGVAVENARLYQQQRQVAEQLRISEQKYRQLFEDAHDAIWLHDLEGNILSANRACVQLAGYSLEELRKLRQVELLSVESLEATRGVQERLLRGDALGLLHELKLVRKDGSEVLVQVASSVVYSDRRAVAFQHIARDVTEEKRMQENLHYLLQYVTRAQEDERKRIAREIHDDTIQALVVHGQQIYNLANTAGLPEYAVSRLEELRRQVNNTIQELRRLSQDLRPVALDRLGLLSSLRQLGSDVAAHSGIATEVKVIGVERRLPAEVELVLFRIAQEALRNVWKHAQATAAETTVEFCEGKTRVTVSDNGKGFDAQQAMLDLKSGKLGLAGMRERAGLLGGTLTVRSEPGKGTTLAVELPT